MPKTAEKETPNVDALFEAGAHYGFSKSRRHPTTKPFIFGTRNQIEIFDLEKTSESLSNAKAFVKKLAVEGKKILFVASKHEARNALRNGADSVNQPYVARRWVGGTLTNFKVIRKRIDKLISLKEQREKGELSKYTKKEQLLIDREIEALEDKFGGIVDVERMPGALFVIDPREESIAIAEADNKDVPVIALANSDCNLDEIEYPIPGNDAARKSIEFFINEIVDAYREGMEERPVEEKNKKSEARLDSARQARNPKQSRSKKKESRS